MDNTQKYIKYKHKYIKYKQKYMNIKNNKQNESDKNTENQNHYVKCCYGYYSLDW